MSLGRPPAYPDLYDLVHGMQIFETRHMLCDGKTYDKNGKHLMQVAAYNYGWGFGYRVRTLVHDDRIFVIRVA